MTIPLTRREFLELCGASSVGLMLAACGVAPTPTPAPTSAPTASITATATSTNTPLPTVTPTLTPTTVPELINSLAWAAPDELRDISINGLLSRKRAIDLKTASFKILADTGKDVSKLDAEVLQATRVQLADILNKDSGLRAQMTQSKTNLLNDRRFRNTTDFSNFYATVSLDKNTKKYQATSVMIKTFEGGKEIVVRFKVKEDGSLNETTSNATQREVGEKIGYLKGSTFDRTEPGNRWNDERFKRAVNEEWSAYQPVNSFMPYVFYLPTTTSQRIADQRQANLDRILANDQIFHSQLYWSGSDDSLFSEGLRKDKQKYFAEVKKYEQKVTRENLEAIKYIRSKGGKPCRVLMTNENFWGNATPNINRAGWNGKDGVNSNCHFDVHGENIIINAYLMYDALVAEYGLQTGVDFELLNGDFNISKPSAKVNLIASETRRAREEIARRKNIPINEVYLDIAAQIRERFDPKFMRKTIDGRIFDNPPPTEEDLRSVVRTLQTGGRKVHFIEVAQIGLINDNDIVNFFSMVDKVGIQEGVASCTYWDGMLPVGVPDNDVKNGMPTADSPRFFDADGKPTVVQRMIVQNMMNIADQMGIL